MYFIYKQAINYSTLKKRDNDTYDDLTCMSVSIKMAETDNKLVLCWGWKQNVYLSFRI